jgi:hypothetical protein
VNQITDKQNNEGCRTIGVLIEKPEPMASLLFSSTHAPANSKNDAEASLFQRFHK